MDDLYTIVIVKERPFADYLKEKNARGEIVNSSQLKLSEHQWPIYHYSSNLAVLHSRNDPFRTHRHIIEHVIVLTMHDLSKSSVTRFLLESQLWSLDLDVVILNQIMFTFNRQPGFLVRNDTQESWYWNRFENEYADLAPSFRLDWEPEGGTRGGYVVYQIMCKVILIL